MTYRKRWDLKANPAGEVMLAVASAVAIAIGDLIWLDQPGGIGTGNALPLSDPSLWTGTTAGTQGRAADQFAGVAMSAHPAGNTQITQVRVATRGTFGYPLQTAAVIEVGTLIGASKDPAANLMQSQVVDVANSQNGQLAIGRAQIRHPVAVSFVEFEIFSRLAAGGGVRNYLTS